MKKFLWLAFIFALAAGAQDNETPKQNDEVINFEITDNDELNGMLQAIANDDWFGFQKLINDGVDINIKDKSGATALLYAVTFGETDMVKLLIDKDADVNVQTVERKLMPIMLAAMDGNIDIIKLLLAKDATLDAQSPYSGNATG